MKTNTNIFCARCISIVFLHIFFPIFLLQFLFHSIHVCIMYIYSSFVSLFSVYGKNDSPLYQYFHAFALYKTRANVIQCVKCLRGEWKRRRIRKLDEREIARTWYKSTCVRNFFQTIHVAFTFISIIVMLCVENV